MIKTQYFELLRISLITQLKELQKLGQTLYKKEVILHTTDSPYPIPSKEALVVTFQRQSNFTAEYIDDQPTGAINGVFLLTVGGHKDGDFITVDGYASIILQELAKTKVCYYSPEDIEKLPKEAMEYIDFNQKYYLEFQRIQDLDIGWGSDRPVKAVSVRFNLKFYPTGTTYDENNRSEHHRISRH